MLDAFADLTLRLARVIVAEVEETAAERRPVPEAAAEVTAAETGAADPAAASPAGGQRAVWHAADLALHRLSRAARLCMILSDRLADGRLDRGQRRAKERAGTGRPRRPGLKGEIESRVRDAIEREIAEPDEQEVLLRALAEKLDEEDIEHDLDRYTGDEVAAMLCRTLGLDPDAAVWTEDDRDKDAAGHNPAGSAQARRSGGRKAPGFVPMIIERVIVDPPDYEALEREERERERQPPSG